MHTQDQLTPEAIANLGDEAHVQYAINLLREVGFADAEWDFPGCIAIDLQRENDNYLILMIGSAVGLSDDPLRQTRITVEGTGTEQDGLPDVGSFAEIIASCQAYRDVVDPGLPVEANHRAVTQVGLQRWENTDAH